MRKKVKMLLVLDEPEGNRHLKDRLAGLPEYDVAVLNASLLAEGIEMLGKGAFDLVLVDLDLADSRGRGIILELRRRAPAIPIVLLTGQTDEELASSLLQLDVQDYLTKEGLSREQLGRSLRYALQLKRATEALREREERYKTLIDSIDEGFCVIEMRIEPGRPLDYRFLEVNRAFEKQSTLADAQGKWMRELRPDHEEYWFEIYRDVALTGEPIRFERCGRALQERCFSVYAFRLGPPDRRQVAVLFDDITEQKRAEHALYESEQRLRLFIEYAPAALAMFDRDMRYLSASRRWRQEYWPEWDGDLVGRLAYEAHEVPECWKDVHRRGLAGEVVGAEEDFFERPDGSARWVRWEIRPWYGVSGEVGGIVIFTEDVTSRKKFEEQLRTLNEELGRRVEARTRELQDAQSQYLHAEKLSAVGKLSASIAHEFSNPLQGLIAILKGLKMNSQLKEEDRELLEVALAETERMRNLIRNLQEFNRPSAGRKVSMDVHEAVNTLLLLCKSDFRRKRIATALKYAERMPRIMAIPDQIKQVLLNLLNNAADAIESDGVITISTCHEARRIAVTIQDTGTGIAPDRMKFLFQPFYSTKPDVKGTGLGLSVCHSIVHNHRGNILVESEEGKGSIFTVLLPISDEDSDCCIENIVDTTP